MSFIPREEYLRVLECLPILCVDCVISFEGKCLLLRRTNEPAKGQYWFAGGRVYKNETIRAAALRKATEEVGLACRFEEILSIEETMFAQQGDMTCDVHTVNVCCHLVAQSAENVVLDLCHDRYVWVDSEQALSLKLHEGVITPIVKCLNK